MLLKLIGIVLVIIACTGIGYSKSWEMKKQLEELEILEHIFSLLKNEMDYSHGTFDELFMKIGEKFPGKYGNWLLNLGKRLQKKDKYLFADIWSDSIMQDLDNTYLREEDLKEIETLGTSLGYLESIELYIKQLEYEIEIRREEYRSKRKLCQSMGIMGGVFLVILLL